LEEYNHYLRKTKPVYVEGIEFNSGEGRKRKIPTPDILASKKHKSDIAQRLLIPKNSHNQLVQLPATSIIPSCFNINPSSQQRQSSSTPFQTLTSVPDFQHTKRFPLGQSFTYDHLLLHMNHQIPQNHRLVNFNPLFPRVLPNPPVNSFPPRFPTFEPFYPPSLDPNGRTNTFPFSNLPTTQHTPAQVQSQSILTLDNEMYHRLPNNHPLHPLLKPISEYCFETLLCQISEPECVNVLEYFLAKKYVQFSKNNSNHFAKMLFQFHHVSTLSYTIFMTFTNKYNLSLYEPHYVSLFPLTNCNYEHEQNLNFGAENDKTNRPTLNSTHTLFPSRPSLSSHPLWVDISKHPNEVVTPPCRDDDRNDIRNDVRDQEREEPLAAIAQMRSFGYTDPFPPLFGSFRKPSPVDFLPPSKDPDLDSLIRSYNDGIDVPFQNLVAGLVAGREFAHPVLPPLVNPVGVPEPSCQYIPIWESSLFREPEMASDGTIQKDEINAKNAVGTGLHQRLENKLLFSPLDFGFSFASSVVKFSLDGLQWRSPESKLHFNPITQPIETKLDTVQCASNQSPYPSKNRPLLTCFDSNGSVILPLDECPYFWLVKGQIENTVLTLELLRFFKTRFNLDLNRPYLEWVESENITSPLTKDGIETPNRKRIDSVWSLLYPDSIQLRGSGQEMKHQGLSSSVDVIFKPNGDQSMENKEVARNCPPFSALFRYCELEDTITEMNSSKQSNDGLLETENMIPQIYTLLSFVSSSHFRHFYYSPHSLASNEASRRTKFITALCLLGANPFATEWVAAYFGKITFGMRKNRSVGADCLQDNNNDHQNISQGSEVELHIRTKYTPIPIQSPLQRWIRYLSKKSEVRDLSETMSAFERYNLIYHFPADFSTMFANFDPNRVKISQNEFLVGFKNDSKSQTNLRVNFVAEFDQNIPPTQASPLFKLLSNLEKVAINSLDKGVYFHIEEDSLEKNEGIVRSGNNHKREDEQNNKTPTLAEQLFIQHNKNKFEKNILMSKQLLNQAQCPTTALTPNKLRILRCMIRYLHHHSRYIYNLDDFSQTPFSPSDEQLAQDFIKNLHGLTLSYFKAPGISLLSQPGYRFYTIISTLSRHTVSSNGHNNVSRDTITEIFSELLDIPFIQYGLIHFENKHSLNLSHFENTQDKYNLEYLSFLKGYNHEAPHHASDNVNLTSNMEDNDSISNPPFPTPYSPLSTSLPTPPTTSPPQSPQLAQQCLKSASHHDECDIPTPLHLLIGSGPSALVNGSFSSQLFSFQQDTPLIPSLINGELYTYVRWLVEDAGVISEEKYKHWEGVFLERGEGCNGLERGTIGVNKNEWQVLNPQNDNGQNLRYSQTYFDRKKHSARQLVMNVGVGGGKFDEKGYLNNLHQDILKMQNPFPNDNSYDKGEQHHEDLEVYLSGQHRDRFSQGYPSDQNIVQRLITHTRDKYVPSMGNFSPLEPGRNQIRQLNMFKNNGMTPIPSIFQHLFKHFILTFPKMSMKRVHSFHYYFLLGIIIDTLKFLYGIYFPHLSHVYHSSLSKYFYIIYSPTGMRPIFMDFHSFGLLPEIQHVVRFDHPLHLSLYSIFQREYQGLDDWFLLFNYTMVVMSSKELHIFEMGNNSELLEKYQQGTKCENFDQFEKMQIFKHNFHCDVFFQDDGDAETLPPRCSHQSCDTYRRTLIRSISRTDSSQKTTKSPNMNSLKSKISPQLITPENPPSVTTVLTPLPWDDPKCLLYPSDRTICQKRNPWIPVALETHFRGYPIKYLILEDELRSKEGDLSFHNVNERYNTLLRTFLCLKKKKNQLQEGINISPIQSEGVDDIDQNEDLNSPAFSIQIDSIRSRMKMLEIYFLDIFWYQKLCLIQSAMSPSFLHLRNIFTQYLPTQVTKYMRLKSLLYGPIRVPMLSVPKSTHSQHLLDNLKHSFVLENCNKDQNVRRNFYTNLGPLQGYCHLKDRHHRTPLHVFLSTPFMLFDTNHIETGFPKKRPIEVFGKPIDDEMESKVHNWIGFEKDQNNSIPPEELTFDFSIPRNAAITTKSSLLVQYHSYIDHNEYPLCKPVNEIMIHELHHDIFTKKNENADIFRPQNEDPNDLPKNTSQSNNVGNPNLLSVWPPYRTIHNTTPKEISYQLLPEARKEEDNKIEAIRFLSTSPPNFRHVPSGHGFPKNPQANSKFFSPSPILTNLNIQAVNYNILKLLQTSTPPFYFNHIDIFGQSPLVSFLSNCQDISLYVLYDIFLLHRFNCPLTDIVSIINPPPDDMIVFSMNLESFERIFGRLVDIMGLDLTSMDRSNNIDHGNICISGTYKQGNIVHLDAELFYLLFPKQKMTKIAPNFQRIQPNTSKNETKRGNDLFFQQLKKINFSSPEMQQLVKYSPNKCIQTFNTPILALMTNSSLFLQDLQPAMMLEALIEHLIFFEELI
jgi:hypothetical protein